MRLAALFCDHMVLQRDAPLPVWGWGDPGEAITVEVAGYTDQTVVGVDGAWRVTLPGLPAGGPLDMVISGEETIILHDVLVGEVWLCSGQSNMEMSVKCVNNSEEEIEEARYPLIRHFTVQKSAPAEPLLDVEGKWEICSPETVGEFTAAGYFFAREITNELGIPVGLINSSWDSTPAEAWTSREALLSQPNLRYLVEQFDSNLLALDKLLADFKEATRQWYESLPKDTGNSGYELGWASFDADTASWNAMSLPQLWQQAGLDISGVLWFRKEIDIPVEWAGNDVILHLGSIDKSDVSYFNNIEVGSINYFEDENSYCTPRIYPVPGRLVKQGKNLVSVRVFSHCFGGGFAGPESEMYLDAPNLPGARPVVLAGDWQYNIEINFGKVPDIPAPPYMPGSRFTPTVLFNGMIAPLIPYAIRGYLWYQGEGNSSGGGRPILYRTMFPTLIRDWRQRWGQGDIPFYFVQLASYGSSRDEPGESDWALTREAQTMALKEPNTGMALAIDIGDHIEIHPKNKQEIGRRLALIALAQIYGKNIEYSGPVYSSMQIEDGGIRLFFEFAGGGLIAKDGQLSGFAIAGVDRKFVWANARIEGATLVVSSPLVKEPVAVRYAWADYPPSSLYNHAGLPASPFRTDDWQA